MDSVNGLNVIDENQYLVSNTQTVNVKATDFDQIYNSQTEESLDSIFERVARQTGVNVNLLKAVAQAESGFDAGAVSSCGAQGMMQLMPSTAESLGVDDPFDAEQSITGGAKLLSYLLEDYNGNVSLALAAYNAGSGNVAKYGGVPPFNETINYINKINDILGGALSNDSSSIEGASATDFLGVQTDKAPNVALHGANWTETNQRENGLNTYYDGVQTKKELFSFEEYMYFVESYEKIMEKLFDTVNDEMYKSTEENDNSYIRNVSDTGMLRYDVNQANYSMLSHNAIDSLVESDVQSVYQAQASMISPLVERLLGR